MHSVRRFSGVIRHSAAALCLLSSAALPAADWPQFLGPGRNNIAGDDEKPLPAQLPPEGPPVLWEKKLGTGFAGPAVVGGKVIIFHREGDEAVVEAVDRNKGGRLWKFSYVTNYKDRFGFDNGPRATPTVSGGRVFVHGAEGMLHALDLESGALLWKVDTVKDFGSPQGFFGRACAPLVVGDLVYLTPGGDKGKVVVAFNVKDGSVKWSTGEDGASYSSPVMASEKVLVCWLRNHLTTFDARDGTILDEKLFRPSEEASVSSAVPIKTDKGWFISACYGVGSSLWDIGADGKLKMTWHEDNRIDSHYATPVYYQQHVYGYDGRQETGQALCCLSTDTKEVLWESPRLKGGMVVLVKDRVIAVNEGGELWIVKADPSEFDQPGLVQILRAGHRSYPAYSNGVLYARDGQKMVAVQLVK
ncbi:MAG: hypothetical protein JWO94_3843 [Verrucomicrobiaceae bacterium]|nr:hypothetical protein [Verrucomicrobiaceae bacterium]